MNDRIRYMSSCILYIVGRIEGIAEGCPDNVRSALLDTAEMLADLVEGELGNGMKIMLDDGAIMPTRAHETDAGLDLYARETKGVMPGQSVTFNTGVHIEFPHGYYGKIESKSGLNVKHGIVSCGGTIDEGFTGSITVKLYNLSDHEYIFRKGEKVAQLVIMPYLAPEIELVDEMDDTPRGASGFGSTGK